MQSCLELLPEAERAGMLPGFSLLLPTFLIAQASRYQLSLELGKCSLALKVSPSVLQHRVGEEQVMPEGTQSQD